MDIKIVSIEKPEPINFILGQSHFIKTVEDIHETLVTSVPGIKFGLAFCEASNSPKRTPWQLERAIHSSYSSRMVFIPSTY